MAAAQNTSKASSIHQQLNEGKTVLFHNFFSFVKGGFCYGKSFQSCRGELNERLPVFGGEVVAAAPQVISDLVPDEFARRRLAFFSEAGRAEEPPGGRSLAKRLECAGRVRVDIVRAVGHIEKPRSDGRHEEMLIEGDFPVTAD